MSVKDPVGPEGAPPGAALNSDGLWVRRSGRNINQDSELLATTLSRFWPPLSRDSGGCEHKPFLGTPTEASGRLDLSGVLGHSGNRSDLASPRLFCPCCSQEDTRHPKIEPNNKRPKHFPHHMTELVLCPSGSTFPFPAKWLAVLALYCSGCCFSVQLSQHVFTAYLAARSSLNAGHKYTSEHQMFICVPL